MSDGRDRLIKLVGENTVRQYETENHYRLLCGELLEALQAVDKAHQHMKRNDTPEWLAAMRTAIAKATP